MPHRRSAGPWFRRVEGGAEVFTQNEYKDEKEATTKRHRTVTTAIATNDVDARTPEELSLIHI